MECAICGHKFAWNEERRLLVCEHGYMLCSCSGHGYMCLSHDSELPKMEVPAEGIMLGELPLPDGWTLVTLSSRHQVLKATLRKEAGEAA